MEFTDVEKLVVPALLEANIDKFRYESETLCFLFHKKDNYWVQRIPNKYYGMIVRDDGTVLPSYPHLKNYKEDKLHLSDAVVEDKLNGTNICIGYINNELIIKTRTTMNSVDFPVTIFSNNELDMIKDVDINTKLKSMREEMVTKYPDYYINVGNYEFVGLKTQVVVKDLLKDKLDNIKNMYPKFFFFFELIGKINPIVLEGTAEYGIYDFDKDLVLIDILHIETNKFLARYEKEHISKLIGLQIVDVKCRFNTKKAIIESIAMLKEEADSLKQEGFVLKFENTRIKVKSDMVLSAARRSVSIMKGFINLDDLNLYMSKVITVDALKTPDKFNDLVDEILQEANTDYPEDIVIKNKFKVMGRVATQMAIFLADDILNEKQWTDKSELFRYLNSEIPKRFEPLKSYIDFDKEKSTDKPKLKAKLKYRRMKVLNQVTKYCFKNNTNIKKKEY